MQLHLLLKLYVSSRLARKLEHEQSGAPTAVVVVGCNTGCRDLTRNLMASLENSELRAFDPGGDYLLIFNMGDGTGILQKRWLFLGGRLAFGIKDYIDRRFMRKFQAIED